MWNLVLLVACHDGDGKGPPDDDSPIGSSETAHTGTPVLPFVTVEPTLENGSDLVRLAKLLRVTTSVPTRATVVLDDGVRARRLAWPALAKVHALPLVELFAETDYSVTLTLEAEDGVAEDRSLSFSTARIDLPMPRLELLANDGAEPGLRVIPVGDTGPTYLLLVVDSEARPVYVLKTGSDTKAVTFHPDGGWWSLLLFGTVARKSVLGEHLESWAGARDLEPRDTPVDVQSMHHELVFEDDGSFWTFHKTERNVADYPTTTDDPTVTAPAVIIDDHVIHVAPDGTILSDWSMADRLDPTRIGFDSLTENQPYEYDWAHANAIAPVPGEDALLVSLRHQDAVLKLRRSTGDLVWILGNHDGWPPALQPFLLTPSGAGFAWQYHQHAPFPTADGRVLLFDNGNGQRTTPYSHTPDPLPHTRLVQYAVDDATKTITQVAEHQEGLPPLYADTLGNADLLPVTGHAYGTFSYLYREDGVPNESLGRGARSVRLVEVDLGTGTKHWDLRIFSDIDEVARGYQVDRSTVIPTLYPSDVVQEWLE